MFGDTSDEPGDNSFGMRHAMHMFDGPTEETTPAQQWISFGMRLGVQAALHPFQYAKVLIQLGYEPIAPHPGRTFFGKNVLVLPNIFKYGSGFFYFAFNKSLLIKYIMVFYLVSYIKRTDGLAGCYVGLAPQLIGTIVAMVGSEKIANRLGYKEEPNRSGGTKTDQEL